jgi:eukaryotic-like serine/threonine-protein kinase
MSAISDHPATDVVDPDLASGQRVGEYEVDGKLGQGAFGTVFRAVHPLIGKVVAIKVLARRFSVDPEMVSRFIAEARAVNQIRHRHIIDIFSFGQLEDGRHYYVMEYLDGEPLDAAIERRGRIELADALPILRGIGRALDAAHGKGIAHRDLKAENVFLGTDPDGVVFPKLLDFGIAKLLGPEEDTSNKHKTRTGTPVGTPYYMSPEQCRGRNVDHRTDIYAFGVLAYLMLVGHYPLDADDHMSVLIRQLTDMPEAPSVAAGLPAEIDDTIFWLMAKDPAQRPMNLRAAVTALEAAAERAGIAVDRTSATLRVAARPTGGGACDRGTGGWEVASGPHGQLGTAPVYTASARPSGPAELPRRRSRGKIVTIGLVATLALTAGIAAMLITMRMRDPADEPAPPVASPAPAPVLARPPPDAPQEITTVTLAISGVPANTEVIVAGATVGVAPGPVQLPRSEHPVVLTFKVDGYHPASRTIIPASDQALAMRLERKPVPPLRPARRPSRDDIIDDPFHLRSP